MKYNNVLISQLSIDPKIINLNPQKGQINVRLD
jgi:hypothetical protein